MSVPVRSPRPATIARVVHDVRRRQVGRGRGAASAREFKSGDAVRSLAIIENDGICPRKDFGETLVYQGDAGIVATNGASWGKPTTRSNSPRAPPSSSCEAARWRALRAGAPTGRCADLASRQGVVASARLASAWMRATIERNPFERCGVRCSRRPRRSNKAIGSMPKMSLARLPETSASRMATSPRTMCASLSPAKPSTG